MNTNDNADRQSRAKPVRATIAAEWVCGLKRRAACERADRFGGLRARGGVERLRP